ncbi:UDP-N-acetylmuramoyl-L-alanyl-D-glutamate--2,6-diaminopimelate ligase [Pelotomaculum isophthalicicum JI]|uniref:UDP-N-acetylmuramoyl-L-alanyl-D-glutamate--2,6-diaminopimelate ligase n=1 Tax=Pelotomaculum isophthalicicum JI TaxID=947010 RepID=A0A9X4JW60_9FIRM|nr:UDP-N-acetylmuramoyl-L-alanyl-D-glutamate--2,6-diaminopimelate ligase [Pelotomaculum isophthalicicum]MDF9408637.1 UDP-N-acetylmuramoyl-L-alanyl-D-glutamate--2,6-diaminopimelate ligase [Pelotomaculum isophthalicicum JI]
MLLRELLEAVDIRAAGGNHDVRLKGITYDSRKVRPGFLFVSIKGFKSDGHDYVGQAIKRGAVAVVMERELELPPDIAWAVVQDTRHALALLSARFFGDPSKQLKMIGVTGTNGKTTTTSLISSILSSSGEKVGLIGTVHNRIGARIIPVSHTTPESTDLQELLGKMIVEGVGACVMEVSSHALALNRVDGCEFDMAVFTNLTQDHLDFHQSMEDYLEAKLKLFKSLNLPGDKGIIKCAVINADDPAAERFAQAAGGLIYTFGVKNTADVYATEINVNARGVSFNIGGKLGSCQLNLHLTGLFNVYNALGAFTAAAALGVPQEIIKDALENVQGVPGRFEQVDAGQDFTVIVDYAHTPDGLENILKTARQLTRGRLITVYGCGGDRDRGKRPMMGSIAAKYSDFQIITSDNPRTENPAIIIQGIIEGVLPLVQKENYLVEQDRRKAIGLAISMARKDDVVIIAGKGHEDYQIIGTEKFPFDDRREAVLAIKELRGDKMD